ncbi:MAG TPA: alanine--tRNA ligase, partial [Elusimicrobia bacterium]|nr:alanine--tRNA ligase [Elusimicrobiota bacterium]
RRLIRRAVRYGQLMGCQEPFLHRLVPSVVEVFQSVYPEIAGASGLVSAGLRMEEERFLETLGAGERELRTLLENASNILPGEQAFKLYDT